MIHPGMIPDEPDIRAMRIVYSRSLEESIDRREHDRPDRVSDVVIGVAIIALIIATCVAFALTPGDASASASVSRREAAIRATCPRAAVMPRKHCIAWLRVAQCETGDPKDRGVTAASVRRIMWRYNGASGYDGGLQFSVRTWRGNIGRVPARRLTRSQRMARVRGAYPLAHRAPAPVQILAADALRVRPDGGMGHWPVCGRRWRG